ncbi:MAG: MMPL family transporter [Deltaproteobacteria bacterium]|nr:MMPL family transporter [Deltaproteobacteria bacterium]
MTSFTRRIIQYRFLIIVVTALTTLGAGWLMRTLHANNDVMRFLPQDDPDIQLFHRVNERFGGLDVAIIGLENDALFTTRKIAAVREMSRRLKEVDGVYDVLSFTELPHFQPSAEGLRVTPLVMDKIPSQPGELALLKKNVLSNANAVGNLVSKDGKAAMVLCFLGGNRPRTDIAKDIQHSASTIWPKDELYFAGSPFIRLYIAGGTYDDLVRLTPVVALVVLLVTFFIFKRPLGVVLSLGTVAIAIVWIMGLVSAGNDGVTLVGSSLPTILVAIGGAYGMHILAAYFNGKSTTVAERISEAMGTAGPPVIASGATTAVGFLSFLVMDIAPLREFGLQAALGVIAAAGMALILTPALLSFQKSPPHALKGFLPLKPLALLGAFSEKHPRSVLIASIVIAAAGATGIRHMAPDATMETFFKKGSLPDKANRFLERNFGGAIYLQIYFEGDLRSPFVLRQLQKVVEFARGLNEVAQVSAITDSLIMMNEAMGGRADIPLTNRRAGSLYPFLEGTAAIDQMISAQKDASLVQIRLKDIDAQQVSMVIAQFRKFIRKEIPMAIEAFQVGPLAIPDLAFREYSSAALKSPDGRIIKAAWQTPIQHQLSQKELSKKKLALMVEISKRLTRLARIHQSNAVPKDAQTALYKLLSTHMTSGPMAPGPDLQKAVKRVVKEHIVTDFAFLDANPLADDALEGSSLSPAEQEWDTRQRRVEDRLVKEATAFIPQADMERFVSEALPLTAERDPEGLLLTSEAMAQSLALERSVVVAERLLPSVLKILNAKRPSREFQSGLKWALTDVAAPVYGFAGSGKSAVPILMRVTGSPVVNVALGQSTISNQVKSLSLSFALILLILIAVLRSFSAAVKGMAPPLLMLLVSAGVMGAFQVPIDISTSMIATIALGIGADYSIHYLWRCKIRKESLANTTSEVGPSVLANALQVSMGFSVLCLSSMIPMQRFGLLIALTMVLAALLTFVLLPAMRPQR